MSEYMLEKILLVICLFVSSWLFGSGMRRIVEKKDRGFWSLFDVVLLGVGCILLMMVLVFA